jgi:hypothetical protein
MPLLWSLNWFWILLRLQTCRSDGAKTETGESSARGHLESINSPSQTTISPTISGLLGRPTGRMPAKSGFGSQESGSKRLHQSFAHSGQDADQENRVAFGSYRTPHSELCTKMAIDRKTQVSYYSLVKANPLAKINCARSHASSLSQKYC